MNKKIINISYFLGALIVSSVLVFGINEFQQNLEVFLSWQLVKNDPQIMLAYLGLEPIKIIYPIRKTKVANLDPDSLTALSAVVAEIKKDGSITYLFKKNPNLKLPIASITKLMAADIVFQNLDLMSPVKISRESVLRDESLGNLKMGETLLVNDLLYIALIESSNDAMYALAEQIGIPKFVELMQKRAKEIGMVNTFFVNPTGVDPNPPETAYNYSTAEDLVKLAKAILEQRPEIWKILQVDKIDLYAPDGSFHHTLVNTNKIINSIPRFVGAKTGWTPMAKQTMLLVQKNPREGFLVYVILGSEDRFGEMKRLVEWVNKAWVW